MALAVPYRLFLFFFVRSYLRPTHRFSHKTTVLIRKITKQDEETIEKRAEEVPESSQTVCLETEVLFGYGAQH